MDIESFNPDKIVVIDIETTGFDAYYDEILQLAAINGRGEVLFCDYFKPKHRRTWRDAEEVNGISPEMVSKKPSFEDSVAEIEAAISGMRVVVGHNIKKFDIPFLNAHGVSSGNAVVFDTMLEYQNVTGREKWARLQECASAFGYQFNAHDALEDCRASLFCAYKIADRSNDARRLLSGALLSFNIGEKSWTGAQGAKNQTIAPVSLSMIPTPSGSSAKPHFGVFHEGNVVFEVSARSSCYRTLCERVDDTAESVMIERRRSFVEDGFYYHIELSFECGLPSSQSAYMCPPHDDHENKPDAFNLDQIHAELTNQIDQLRQQRAAIITPSGIRWQDILRKAVGFALAFIGLIFVITTVFAYMSGLAKGDAVSIATTIILVILSVICFVLSARLLGKKRSVKRGTHAR